MLTQVPTGSSSDRKSRLSWQLKNGAKKRPPFEALLNGGGSEGAEGNSSPNVLEVGKQKSSSFLSATSDQEEVGGEEESSRSANSESNLILLKDKLEAMMSAAAASRQGAAGGGGLSRETASRKPLPLYDTVTPEAMAERRSAQGLSLIHI